MVAMTTPEKVRGGTPERIAVKRAQVRHKRDTSETKRLQEAAELERRAASLTFTMATLDEERARLLIRAQRLRYG